MLTPFEYGTQSIETNTDPIGQQNEYQYVIADESVTKNSCSCIFKTRLSCYSGF